MEAIVSVIHPNKAAKKTYKIKQYAMGDLKRNKRTVAGQWFLSNTHNLQVSRTIWANKVLIIFL